MPRSRKTTSARSLTAGDLSPITRGLARANGVFKRAYPGDAGARQPVHTVYGGAHLFKADTAPRLGALALETLRTYAPDPKSLAKALGLRHRPGMAGLERTLYARVIDKLRREPVEDFRVDFEDGYGNRPDAEEDHQAGVVAHEMASGLAAEKLPPFIGIRIKPMSEELRDRSIRTLDLFVTTLVRATGRNLPPELLITVPKIVIPEQVSAVARVCAALERRLALAPRVLKLELMIETPQAIVGPGGSVAIRELVAAGGNRVVAVHFGTYDYTALCNITAAHQQMQHATCDFAKQVMQVALAQTGIRLSDGATNVMPVPIHAAPPGRRLSRSQQAENRDAVHRAWRMHFDDVQHSLVNGFYQGWDLHPAQLVTRYASVYAFFLSARPAAAERLRNFVEKAAQATLVGDVFDDAATGQGLLNVFIRGLNSGAITADEAAETGVTPDEFQMRSFMRILEARRAR